MRHKIGALPALLYTRTGRITTSLTGPTCVLSRSHGAGGSVSRHYFQEQNVPNTVGGYPTRSTNKKAHHRFRSEKRVIFPDFEACQFQFVKSPLVPSIGRQSDVRSGDSGSLAPPRVALTESGSGISKQGHLFRTRVS